MRVIDLTMPIAPHWRYGLEQRPARRFDEGSVVQTTWFALQTHWYTHIDVPRHFSPDGATLEQYPLDLLVGDAVILDVSDQGENAPIDAGKLEKAFAGLARRDIILVKSCRGRKVSMDSREFWDGSPYLTADAADWLYSLEPKVVGFDFPQDRDIRRRDLPDNEKEHTTHERLLRRGVLLIEYLTNFWSLGEAGIIRFAGLPLKLIGVDGAPIRAVALLDA
ncbi:MAG: cyclase family protein [Planctomycetota bacterium]|jgi:kynurenine formamidase|nr:cyclase family protein [Planctomycetota bacterium]